MSADDISKKAWKTLNDKYANRLKGLHEDAVTLFTAIYGFAPNVKDYPEVTRLMRICQEDFAHP